MLFSALARSVTVTVATVGELLTNFSRRAQRERVSDRHPPSPGAYPRKSSKRRTWSTRPVVDRRAALLRADVNRPAFLICRTSSRRPWSELA